MVLLPRIQAYLRFQWQLKLGCAGYGVVLSAGKRLDAVLRRPHLLRIWA
jgi:hypothetical protein